MQPSSENLETQVGDTPPPPVPPEVSELPPGGAGAEPKRRRANPSRRNVWLVAIVVAAAFITSIVIKLRNSDGGANTSVEAKISPAVVHDLPDAPDPGGPVNNPRAAALEDREEKERRALAEKRGDNYFPQFGSLSNFGDAGNSADRAAGLPTRGGPGNVTEPAGMEAAEPKAVEMFAAALERVERKYAPASIRSYPVPDAAPPVAGSAKGVESNERGKPDIEQGTILVASVKTEVNSYQPGTPVVADIETGAFRGARVLGTFQESGGKLIIQFNTIRHKGGSAAIRAYAVDKETNAAAVRSDIDHHYMDRFGLVAAAALVGSLRESSMYENTQVTLSPFGTTGYQIPKIKDRLGFAIGTAGQSVQQVFAERAKQVMRPEVTLHQGELIGVLFMDSVSLGAANPAPPGGVGGLPSAGTLP